MDDSVSVTWNRVLESIEKDEKRLLEARERASELEEELRSLRKEHEDTKKENMEAGRLRADSVKTISVQNRTIMHLAHTGKGRSKLRPIQYNAAHHTREIDFGRPYASSCHLRVELKRTKGYHELSKNKVKEVQTNAKLQETAFRQRVIGLEQDVGSFFLSFFLSLFSHPKLKPKLEILRGKALDAKILSKKDFEAQKAISNLNKALTTSNLQLNDTFPKRHRLSLTHPIPLKWQGVLGRGQHIYHFLGRVCQI